MNQLASSLTSVKGERVALCDVAVSAVLRDLLAEVTVSQTYRNDECVNIEAVYTFPLPIDAVLLELDVEIGGQVLKGVVVERKAAEEQYEDAVEAGDAAVMLEAIEPGLYTMNVGNLLPRETAKITIRYAILHRWAGDRLRFFLPTTVAPRFGDSPHRPHQAPEASLTVENQFSVCVEIFGALRDARFDCPSHAVDLVRSTESTLISLRQSRAVMDRDFILNVSAPQATRSFVLCGADGEGLAAVASFQPFFPGLRQSRPLNLAIVIDCSGSMLGDSMEQAKQALASILDGLQPQDRISLIAFGNSTKVLSDHPLPCDTHSLIKARQFAGSLAANMGGTEIGHALRAAYKVVGGSEPADIFLVTDGEVSAWESVVAEAMRSGHRIFTVGVGSAVSEAFVRQLAETTGGECELVSPREGMAERVVRHFERMRAPRAKRVTVRWPEGAACITPAQVGAVFDGDTVVASARFERAPMNGGVILEIETGQGEIVRQELLIPAVPAADSPDGLSTVARVAAAARLKGMEGVAGLETALRYRLVSPWTNWLVVAPRVEGEKALDIPALRKVPQSLAAGWGGVGNVTTVHACLSVSAFDRAYYARMMVDETAQLPDLITSLAAPETPVLDLPEPYQRLLALIEEDTSRIDMTGALGLLSESGVASDFDGLFRQAADLGLSADVIGAIVLARLLDGPLREFLPDGAEGAMAKLHERAREAMDDLEKIGRRSIDTGRAPRRPTLREKLWPRAAREARNMDVRIRELLDSLEEAIREAHPMRPEGAPMARRHPSAMEKRRTIPAQ